VLDHHLPEATVQGPAGDQRPPELLAGLIRLDHYEDLGDAVQVLSPLALPVVHTGYADCREASVPGRVSVGLTLDQEDVAGVVCLLQLVEPVEDGRGAPFPPELVVAAGGDPVSGGDLLTALVGVGDLDRRNLPAQRPYVTRAILKGYIIAGEEL
jgi:hypothetical protein